MGVEIQIRLSGRGVEGCTHGASFQASQVSDFISLVNIPCVFLGRDLAACVLCRGVDRGCGGSSGLQSESSRFCWVNWLSPQYSPQESSFFPGLDHLPLPYFLSFSKKKKVFFQLISPLILTLFGICAFFYPLTIILVDFIRERAITSYGQ